MRASGPRSAPRTDFQALHQAVIELDPGDSVARCAGEHEEVLFVLDGEGSLRLDGTAHALEPESGAYLAPGEEYAVANTGDRPLKLVSVRIPDPDATGAAGAQRAVVRRLADQQSESATTDREFRIVADPGDRSALSDPLRRLHPDRPRARALPHLQRGHLRARRRGCNARRGQ